MKAPKALTYFRWETNVAILCVLTGIGYTLVDAGLRKLEYRIVELNSGPYHRVTIKDNYLIGSESLGSIDVYTLPGVDHVWSGKGPRRIQTFLHDADSNNVYLLGDRLGILSKEQSGWMVTNDLTRSDLEDLGHDTMEVQFVSINGEQTDLFQNFEALEVDGQFIIGKLDADTQEFIPSFTHQTEDFLLIIDKDKSSVSRQIYYVYKISYVDEGTLQLIYCYEWRTRGVWPGPEDANLFLETGYREVNGRFGETTEYTLNLISLGDCLNASKLETFTDGFNHYHGAISPDGNSVFFIADGVRPVEYGFQENKRKRHRSVIGPITAFFAKYAVTGSFVDWEAGEFYLVTNHRYLYIGKLDRPK